MELLDLSIEREIKVALMVLRYQLGKRIFILSQATKKKIEEVLKERKVSGENAKFFVRNFLFKLQSRWLFSKEETIDFSKESALQKEVILQILEFEICLRGFLYALEDKDEMKKISTETGISIKELNFVAETIFDEFLGDFFS